MNVMQAVCQTQTVHIFHIFCVGLIIFDQVWMKPFAELADIWLAQHVSPEIAISLVKNHDTVVLFWKLSIGEILTLNFYQGLLRYEQKRFVEHTGASVLLSAFNENIWESTTGFQLKASLTQITVSCYICT